MVAELEPKEIVRRYLDPPKGEGWSLRKLCTFYRADRARIQRILDEAGVKRRNVGRPQIPPKEWLRRKKAASESVTWEEVRAKLGLEPWEVNPEAWMARGIRLKEV